MIAKEWTREWPKEVGWYWVYRKPRGSDKYYLDTGQVRQASNSLIYKTGSMILYKVECEDIWWLPLKKPTSLPNIITWEPLPDFGDLMPIKEFIRDCNDGSFMDYDGHGYLATKTEMSNLLIRPSFIKQIIEEWPGFPYVMWFNK